MAQVRQALDLVLARAMPYPALVVDRRWDLVRANAGLGLLLDGVAPELLVPPVNVLRVSLHPDGLQSHLEEFGRYSAHVLAVLRRQAVVLGDAELVELHAELADLPGEETSGAHEPGGVVLPLRVRTPLGLLSFFTTAARFGTAADVTLAELTVESLFPADASTAAAVEEWGAVQP